MSWGDTFPNHNSDSYYETPYILLSRYLEPFGEVMSGFRVWSSGTEASARIALLRGIREHACKEGAQSCWPFHQHVEFSTDKYKVGINPAAK